MNAPVTLNAYGWQKEAARRARADGVRLLIDPAIKVPSAGTSDGKTFEVRIPALPLDATHDDFLIYRRSFIHELGHIARRECFEIQKTEGLRFGTRRWFCFNAIEDSAQEREVQAEHIGDRKALNEGLDALMARIIGELETQSPLPPEVTDEQRDHALKIGSLSALILGSSDDWSPTSRIWAERMVDARERTLPGSRALWDDLKREGWTDRIRTVGSCVNVANLATDLYKRLWPEDSDEKPTEEEQKTEAESLGNVIPWQVLMRSDHSDDKTDSDDTTEPHPSRVDWTGKTERGSVSWYTDEQITALKAVPTPPGNRQPDSLAQEVRRLLQSLARVRWRSEKLYGRLDKRNLARVAMPRVGNGDWNYAVFKQRDPVFALDAAVTLLVDSSGSMSGNKYLFAALAATALYRLFAKSLRIPTEVIGFTTSRRTCLPHYLIHKTFAERTMPEDAIYGRMIEGSKYLAGNADGDALMFSLERIIRRRESRRIIVVLSDGSPTEALGGDADAALFAAIRAARATRGVEVYGIGIMDTNVRRYYSPAAPVIAGPEEIAPALLTALRDILQRRPME